MNLEKPRAIFALRDTVRLVSTGRLKELVLRPLAAGSDTLDVLAGLESITNGRPQAEESGLPDLDPRELVFGRAGYTFINAAFTHATPGGSRFNGEERGAWYSAFAAETALAEVAIPPDPRTRSRRTLRQFDRLCRIDRRLFRDCTICALATGLRKPRSMRIRRSDTRRDRRSRERDHRPLHLLQKDGDGALHAVPALHVPLNDLLESYRTVTT